jgi:hypothetical protein
LSWKGRAGAGGGDLESIKCGRRQSLGYAAMVAGNQSISGGRWRGKDVVEEVPAGSERASNIPVKRRCGAEAERAP